MARLFQVTPYLADLPNRYDVLSTPREGSCSIRTVGAAAFKRAVKAHAPALPGIYGMIDADGLILYIGKAKNLRKRLTGYFRRSNPERKKAGRLFRRTAELFWEVAPNEFSALLRELQLIQHHRPRFNVIGQPRRKSRVYICLGRAPAAYAFMCRKPPKTFHSLVGPIPFSPRIKAALRYINDAFTLRDCPQQQRVSYADQNNLFTYHGSAGCLRYELKTCLGPCIAACTQRQYSKAVKGAVEFLQGKQPELLIRAEMEMKQSARNLHFEKAGLLRDAHEALVWLDGTLRRLRKAREELNFVYNQEAHDGSTLCYYLEDGQCRGVYPTPSDDAERKRLEKELATLRKNAAGISLDAIDHVWLMTAWFRKFPRVS